MNTTSKAAAGSSFRFGYVVIAGRPNVGKSTLLNSLLGHRLSITSRRPQTTRWRILGIKTASDYQAVFVDTPGFQTSHRHALDRHMNREVDNALAGVDVVLFVVEALKWTPADEKVLGMLLKLEIPLVLVINKVDKVKPRERLLAFMKKIAEQAAFITVVPVSARKHDNVDELEREVARLLPEGQAQYPEDLLTDRPERFLAAEFIREKLTRKLAKELPYSISVTIEKFRKRGGVLHVDATIWVETESQKSIVIGKEGKLLKAVGQEARYDMEELFGHRVNLHTWVKVRRRWTRSDGALQQLGYREE